MEKNQKLIELGEKITRKEAIKKAGVTALAASSLLLLNTQAKAQASGGNPGNNKPVGKAGENPNGSGNWGSGDKGKSK